MAGVQHVTELLGSGVSVEEEECVMGKPIAGRAGLKAETIQHKDGKKVRHWVVDPNVAREKAQQLTAPTQPGSALPLASSTAQQTNSVMGMMETLQARRRQNVPQPASAIELTDTQHPHNPNLWQIRATRDIPGQAEAGDLGGWVENPDNVRDDAWVGEGAMVMGNAIVRDNAYVGSGSYVGDNALVEGNAWVVNESTVEDNAHVAGNARIINGGYVCGDAYVCGGETREPGFLSGEAWVDNGYVRGSGQLLGRAVVCDEAAVDGGTVTGNAHVSGSFTHIGGSCLVKDYATVSDGGVVGENAVVGDYATVSNDAYVGGTAIVSDSSEVLKATIVRDGAKISGKAKVEGSIIEGNTVVTGRATVTSTTVKGRTLVGGNTILVGGKQQLRKGNFVTVVLNEDAVIMGGRL